MLRFLTGLILGASAATFLIAWLLTSSRSQPDFTETASGGRGYGLQWTSTPDDGPWT